jgi:hypothetical protein
MGEAVRQLGWRTAWTLDPATKASDARLRLTDGHQLSFCDHCIDSTATNSITHFNTSRVMRRSLLTFELGDARLHWLDPLRRRALSVVEGFV